MSVWRYSQPFKKEPRWYPKGAWGGWFPTPEPLTPDEMEEADAMDGFDLARYVETIAQRGYCEHDYLLPPKSGDSWLAFYHRNSIGFGPEWNGGRYEPEYRYQQRKYAQRSEHKAAVEQRAWEEARLERLRLQQAASDAEWAAAERKVQEAAEQLAARRAAERAADAAEQAARLVATQREAERRRIQQERAAATRAAQRAQRDAEFYANERREWIECLRNAIAECEGTPYAVLIPQMQGDIANIESQPPGSLPWRFDRVAFYRHFEGFKAKVGVPHRG